MFSFLLGTILRGVAVLMWSAIAWLNFIFLSMYRSHCLICLFFLHISFFNRKLDFILSNIIWQFWKSDSFFSLGLLLQFVLVTVVFMPGKSHGRRSLVGYNPWCRRVRHNWATYVLVCSVFVSWVFWPISVKSVIFVECDHWRQFLVSLCAQSFTCVWLFVTRQFFCPWNFPGKNTGVGCHFIFQGISPTQG